MEELLLSEKYRPRKIADCILPARIKNIFLEFVAKKEIPSLLLSGPAGSGKTTIAKALCEEVGVNYMVINASDDNGIATFRVKIKNFASTKSFNGFRKVVILDEADYLTTEAQAALRSSFEDFSKNCTFILTCNFKSRLIPAIHSRTTDIDFRLLGKEKPQMASKFFSRLENILKTENIEYDKPSLIKLVEKFFPDFRRTLNEIQKFSASGKIDAGVISDLVDIKNVKDLFVSLKSQDYQTIRKWVIDNSDVDTANLYRRIYEGFSEYLKPHSIPQGVIILAKYQYQAAFVPDNEINLMACMIELMVETEYL